MNNFNKKYGEKQFINRSQWADTYKAVNSITQDIVTLKVIINNSNNKEYIDNLQKEVRILKEMENHNLICINTVGSIVGEGNTYLYIECENFSGISLKEKLQSGKLNGVEAIKILKQVAEGLKEFHFKSLIYGNLSCDNIYIDENGTVKIDTLAYLEGKMLNESLEEEFSEEDIYSLGVILFELLTKNTNFKPGKCNHEISDEELLYIIDKCTNKKNSTYEDLNKFIEDADAYLEYGAESTAVDTQEEVLIEVDDEDREVEIKKKPYKIKPLKLMISLGACLLVFLILSTIINGGSLFNKKNDETASAKPPAVTKTEEEIPEEEEPVGEEAPEVEPVSNNNDNYSEPVYNNTDNNYDDNNTSNGYYPNNGNSSSNNNNSNNNSNNSNNNNNGNNSGNNGNNGGNQYPGEDDTDNPGGDTNNPGDGSGEETPTPDPLPEPNLEPTPDPTPDSGNSDIGLESETE